MAQLVRIKTPQHPDSRVGDVMSVYEDGTISYGPGYLPENVDIIEIPSWSAQELTELANALEPDIRSYKKAKNLEGKEKIEYQKKDGEFQEILKLPKHRANLKNLTNDDIVYLNTCSKEEAMNTLVLKGISCIEDQIEELAV